MSKRVTLDGEPELSPATGGNRQQLYQFLLGALFLGLIGMAFYMIRKENKVKILEEEAQEAIWPAQKHFEDKKYEKALKGDGANPGFEEIAATWPTTKVGQLAQYYIALIKIQRGNKVNKKDPEKMKSLYQEALQKLGKLAFEDPSFQALVLVLQGDLYSQLGEYEKALTYYDQAIQTLAHPEIAPRALMKKAAIYLHQKKISDARACWEKILKEFPTSSHIRKAKASLSYYSEK